MKGLILFITPLCTWDNVLCCRIFHYDCYAEYLRIQRKNYNRTLLHVLQRWVSCNIYLHVCGEQRKRKPIAKRITHLTSIFILKKDSIMYDITCSNRGDCKSPQQVSISKKRGRALYICLGDLFDNVPEYNQ